MIIDCHTHIFEPDIVRNREKYLDDANFRHLFHGVKARLADHTSLLASMDESGVDLSVAMGFPWVKEERSRAQNEYFREVMRAAEGRILCFGSVPQVKESGIEAAVREIKDMGLCGIGEIAFYEGGLDERNAGRLRGILEAAGTNSLPVCLHVNEPVGHAYPGKYDPEFGRLYSVLKDFGGQSLILSHWGGGLFFYEMMPEVGKALAAVFYDTAASPLLYDDAVYEVAMKIVGSEKILFGSDYPLLPAKRYLSSLETRVGKGSDRRNILGENVRRLLKRVS